MVSPAVKRPILPDQILAAVEIRNYLAGWGAANGVLASLARMMPTHDFESALAKAAVLNQLYFTNVMAVFRMGKHIEALANAGVFIEEDPVEVVRAIAALDGEDSKRKHWVFGAKYAHFFIDPDRYPVYDRLAADTLLFHTGERVAIGERENPYREFYERLLAVKEASGLSAASFAAIDSYLWLTGCYRQWLRRGEKAQINVEVRDYLRSTTGGDSDEERLLGRLVPGEYVNDFIAKPKTARPPEPRP